MLTYLKSTLGKAATTTDELEYTYWYVMTLETWYSWNLPVTGYSSILLDDLSLMFIPTWTGLILSHTTICAPDYRNVLFGALFVVRCSRSKNKSLITQMKSGHNSHILYWGSLQHWFWYNFAMMLVYHFWKALVRYNWWQRWDFLKYLGGGIS